MMSMGDCKHAILILWFYFQNQKIFSFLFIFESENSKNEVDLQRHRYRLYAACLVLPAEIYRSFVNIICFSCILLILANYY